MQCSLITSSQMSQTHLACVVRDRHMCHYCLAERWSVPLMRGFNADGRGGGAFLPPRRHSSFCRRCSSAANQQLIKAFWSNGPRMITYHQILIDIVFVWSLTCCRAEQFDLKHERILKKSKQRKRRCISRRYMIQSRSADCIMLFTHMLLLCLCFHLVWEFVKRQDCLSFPHRLHYL